ncbi:MAG: sugar phosphate isomerase/epimerase [Verrucomicrobia bacterium]|nr:sugar phosphate isomerase/epimerase [Verrucomicrobiota bacterium]
MNIPEQAKSFLSRLAVCSWSLQPTDPAHLVQQLQAIGLTRVQIDLDPFREQPAAWASAAEIFARAGVTLVSGMFRTVGEDYTTLETIRRTGGVVPDGTWDQNWQNLQVTVKNARKLGLPLVMFHAGFLPHDPRDPTFGKLLERIRKIARLFADQGITLCFETGQETAASLVSFLEHLNEPNVAVNFDPANMLLYNNGDPIEALRTIGARVKSCHLKDANVTKTPGTWGDEVPVGTGEVDWPAFFTTMAQINYPGWCCFEREAANQRVADIRAGKQFVEKLLSA